MNQRMRKADPLLAGKETDQVLLDLLRGLLFRQTESLRESRDVGIDHDSGGDPKGCPENDIGRLATNAGKKDERS